MIPQARVIVSLPHAYTYYEYATILDALYDAPNKMREMIEKHPELECVLNVWVEIKTMSGRWEAVAV